MMVSTGWLLVALAVASTVAAAQPAPRPRPLVGAIRWDCWYGATPGGVVAEVERSLGPRKFHFRLPFFAQVLADDRVSINGDSDEVMARELTCAAAAGLDYWAFVDYGEEGDLTIARRRYQAAPDKHGVRYCFVEEGGRLDSHGTAWFARLVQHFANADYLKVCDGRPLLFVFGKPAKLGRAEFTQLGDAAVAAGLQRPYLVFMGWNPEADAKTIAELGLDAVSAYAAGGQYAGTMLSYAALTEQVARSYWETCRRLHIPTVTFATTGWDTRPRIEHPPRWFPNLKPQPDATPAAAQQPLRDAVTATPEQLAAHMQAALDWTVANRDVTPANAVIVYAWNENDEGGWLIPTLDDGDARLRALAKVLRPRP